MKLIIDIPEEMYAQIINEDGIDTTLIPYKDIIKNGTPLDKIRAEIEELDGKYVIGDYATYGEHSPKYVKLMEVLQIIDKYKAESEGE